MNTDVTTIEVPMTIAKLIDELVHRMAGVTGESTEDTRRGVELSILSRGTAAVQAEIAEAENQAERNGWPTTQKLREPA